MTRYPKTPHLPWSSVTDPDDIVLYSCNQFEKNDIVITEKMDGENCLITKNKILLKDRNIKKDVDEKLLANALQIQKRIGENTTVVIESLYHNLAINYNALESKIFGISYWEKDTCMSWDLTTTFFDSINIAHPPILYEGSWDMKVIIDLNSKISLSEFREGYVMRIKKEFQEKNFNSSIAKYVKPFFVQKRIPSFEW